MKDRRSKGRRRRRAAAPPFANPNSSSLESCSLHTSSYIVSYSSPNQSNMTDSSDTRKKVAGLRAAFGCRYVQSNSLYGTNVMPYLFGSKKVLTPSKRQQTNTHIPMENTINHVVQRLLLSFESVWEACWLQSSSFDFDSYM